MKTPLAPSSRSPRLTCRAARAVGLWHGAAVTPDGSGWVARHAATCPACAGFFAGARQLESSLRQEAVDTPVDLPAGLEDRIWAAVRGPVKHSRWADAHWRGFAMPALAAVAVVAVGALWLTRSVGHGGDEGAVARAPAAEFNERDLRELASTLGTYSKALLVPAVQAEEATVAETGALEQEWQALGQDTVSAWKFLAANFIPTSDASAENT